MLLLRLSSNCGLVILDGWGGFTVPFTCVLNSIRPLRLSASSSHRHPSH
jgi:hypothetical protein